MLDYHMHTKISFDSIAEPQEMICAAKNCGLTEICFTEHVDFMFPSSPVQFELPDLAAYDHAFAALDKAGIVVKQGLELGPTADNIEKYESFLTGRNYDFIICSQHFILEQDPYDLDYFKGKTQFESYRLYLTEMARTLRAFFDYDVVGHIGYVSKYWPGKEDKKLQYADHAEVIDEILKIIISNGKGLELNTSGFEKTGDFFPTKEILARYHALGGEIITIGSDAHTSDRVGAHVFNALDEIKQLGFRYICTFTERKPIFHKL